MALSERVFECENCGFSCDRDLNASLNLAIAVSDNYAPLTRFALGLRSKLP
ncbi:MAG: zinc ribbon domain-containing protein [Microcoleaceae cyanobacterium MO_207.B10]|nr:zinc ribbon domain-containing protein [Microcoleaceae cyanobacterium MO_207.B10]